MMWKSSQEQKLLDREPFLSPSDKIPEEDSRSSLFPPSELPEFSKRPSRRTLYLCHVLAISVNLILAVILLWQIQSSSKPRTSPSRLTDYITSIIYLSFIHAVFLKEAIRYKQIKFTSAETSLLFGTLGPETDAAWDRLIDDASLRLSETEVSGFNASSIDLQESPGNLAWLEVSHQIHCVVSKEYSNNLGSYQNSDIESGLRTKSDRSQSLLCAGT